MKRRGGESEVEPDMDDIEDTGEREKPGKIEKLESGDLVEELEELEALEEVPGAEEEEGERAWTEKDQKEELERLLASGAIKSFTLEELQRVAEENKSAIVMEDGVFRIKEEMYLAGDRAREGSLREIAEDVVQHPSTASQAAASEEDGGFSGIGDLIHDEETMDLSKVVSPEREGVSEESLSTESEKSNPILLKRNGLDYDSFLSSYPRSFSHTAQMKSLIEVSRRVSATGAGLFIRSLSGYAPDLTIGISEKTLLLLHFEGAEAFTTRLLASRGAVAVERNPAEIRTLRRKIDEDDLRYMKRLLLLPATFRGQEAYLLLCFSVEADVSPAAVFSKLGIR
ncbi:MAG: hypothetical protein IMZ69_08635 [Spirochaetes bacterium]|nr:hypothetical protein [Spirochaetota bacterium]